jgi:hypothetical protein
LSRTYFTDRDLGNTFPDILAAAGISVVRHRDHFAPDCPDEEWLQVVGGKAWIALTHDARIRYKPNELAAVVRYRVSLLVIVGNARFSELAHNFVATAMRIERFLEAHVPPLIAKIYRPTPAEKARNPSAPGTVSLWYPRR